MALAGVAVAYDNTHWTFDGDISSTGDHVASNPTHGELTIAKNDQGQNDVNRNATFVEESASYIDAPEAGVSFGKYELTSTLGKAITLDGSQTVRLGDAYWTNGTGKLGMGSSQNNAYTIITFVKFTNAASTNTIFATGDQNNGLAFGLRDGDLNLMAKGESDHRIDTNLTNDTWYHLAVTYSAGTATFYVNGDVAGTIEGLGTANFTSPGGQKAVFGAKGAERAEEFMTGAIADFQIHEGALTQKEILAASHLKLIPEPATATLSLLALAGLAARRRRK